MNKQCIICGGTGFTVDGKPCPNCSKSFAKKIYLPDIPMQYQGQTFDRSLLPYDMKDNYGEYLENLLQSIANDIAFFQKNILICSRPNSGKTVWAYNVYSCVRGAGYQMPPIKDLLEVRDTIYSYDKLELANLYTTARACIIRLPKDMQSWMFDIIQTLIERRVAAGGFTIFLFGGSLYDLKQADKYGKLKSMTGTGAFHSIEVRDFTYKKDEIQ